MGAPVIILPPAEGPPTAPEPSQDPLLTYALATLESQRDQIQALAVSMATLEHRLETVALATAAMVVEALPEPEPEPTPGPESEPMPEPEPEPEPTSLPEPEPVTLPPPQSDAGAPESNRPWLVRLLTGR